MLCNNKARCQFIGFSFPQVIINVLRVIYAWGQFFSRFQFCHTIWLNGFLFTGFTLFSDPRLPYFVIQCRVIDFPLGQITNQIEVVLVWELGNKPVFTFRRLTTCIIFSVCLLPLGSWPAESFHISLSQCLGISDKWARSPKILARNCTSKHTQ